MAPWIIAYAVVTLLVAVLFGFLRERARQRAEREGYLSMGVHLQVEQFPPPWIAPAWLGMLPIAAFLGLCWLVCAAPGWLGTRLAQRRLKWEPQLDQRRKPGHG